MSKLMKILDLNNQSRELSLRLNWIPCILDARSQQSLMRAQLATQLNFLSIAPKQPENSPSFLSSADIPLLPDLDSSSCYNTSCTSPAVQEWIALRTAECPFTTGAVHSNKNCKKSTDPLRPQEQRCWQQACRSALVPCRTKIWVPVIPHTALPRLACDDWHARHLPWHTSDAERVPCYFSWLFSRHILYLHAMLGTHEMGHAVVRSRGEWEDWILRGPHIQRARDQKIFAPPSDHQHHDFMMWHMCLRKSAHRKMVHKRLPHQSTTASSLTV